VVSKLAALTSSSDGARDVLNEYFEEIGGRPEPGKKRKGRKSTAAESERETPVTAKRLKKEKEWSPPPGSWEHEVSHVDTVEEAKDPVTGKKTRYAYLVWVNQKKTQHPLPHVYQKCPQRMLEYYESHLVFTNNDLDALNGNNVMDDEGLY
jgi:chromobox protein 1